MSGFRLRFLGDELAPGADLRLAPAPRAIYVARGAATVVDEALEADAAWLGAGDARVAAGPSGATLWRWEVLAAGAAAAEPSLLDAAVGRPPAEGWLLRCDSVAFPPDGCAYLHTHQGPGIRCLREGAIRIDSGGHSQAYLPGEAWFEAGPEPVFAQADAEIVTRFIRVMLLPRALLGKSSIRYVREEDRDKPKSQAYRSYGEAFIAPEGL